MFASLDVMSYNPDYHTSSLRFRSVGALLNSKSYLFAGYMFRKYDANTEIVNMDKRFYKVYSVGYLLNGILFINVHVPMY